MQTLRPTGGECWRNDAIRRTRCAILLLYAYPVYQYFIFAISLPCCAVILFSLTLLCHYFSSHLRCCAYAAVLLFFFALTLLCSHFSSRLPCCALIFLRTYSVLRTLLCLPCSAYPAVFLFFFALTLLWSHFILTYPAVS